MPSTAENIGAGSNNPNPNNQSIFKIEKGAWFRDNDIIYEITEVFIIDGSLMAVPLTEINNPYRKAIRFKNEDLKGEIFSGLEVQTLLARFAPMTATLVNGGRLPLNAILNDRIPPQR